ncbi:ATP-binding protein [Streptomyces sp. G45]|uniref:ATP-binding protein n=1 Tax=Streptomyces sp. G45 TaxID=3406627 RepID=UPI003C2A85EC
MRKRVGKPEVPHPYQGGEPRALVGREREESALRDLLAAHRLVTVTGGAGVGKSRLASALAGERWVPWRRVVRVRWRGTSPGGPGELAAALLQAVTGKRPRRTPVDVADLAARLRGEEVLLFLDDGDPVHAECVGLVQKLLMAVPTLRVLVAARRALGLGEERVLALAPLRTDPPDGPGGRAPAVELFLERARAAAPGFTADGADAAAVAAICRSVEGFPLAVELAAAQVAHYPVRHLADLVERHQCWLHSPRPVLRRHRSLRDALGAGYALCERAVRIVWGRASVFAGAFNESAAVFVCSGGGIEPHEVSACLAQLVALGVIEPLHDPGGPRQPRYRMRRAARDFGAERLGEAGEFEVAAERHVAHTRHLATLAETLWSTGCQAQAVQLVQEEYDDLTATVRYALSHPDHATAALEAVVDLWFWWAVYGRAEEGSGHLLRLLALCPQDDPLVTHAQCLAAWLTASSDPGTAGALIARAWPAAVLDGDDATVGRIAHVQGLLALRHGDARAAAEHFQEAAHTIPDHVPGGPSRAVSLAALAVAQAAFAPRAARRAARRALAGPGLHRDTWACLLARYARAYVDHRTGHGGRAWHRARRALASLDQGVPEPHGAGALRQLIAAVEAGVHGTLPPSGQGHAPSAAPGDAPVCGITLACGSGDPDARG